MACSADSAVLSDEDAQRFVVSGFLTLPPSPAVPAEGGFTPTQAQIEISLPRRKLSALHSGDDLKLLSAEGGAGGEELDVVVSDDRHSAVARYDPSDEWLSREESKSEQV